MNESEQDSPGLLANHIVRFLLAGGLAAICNFGSRFLYSTFLDFSNAVVLAFATGLAVGYFLNKRFVFTRSGNSVPKEMLWFLVINLLALLQTWGLSVYLAKYLSESLTAYAVNPRDWAEAIAHGAGVLLPVFTSYMGHRYLTFRE